MEIIVGGVFVLLFWLAQGKTLVEELMKECGESTWDGIPIYNPTKIDENDVFGVDFETYERPPYQVSIIWGPLIDTFHYCGGAIIDTDAVLTSASCMPSQTVSKEVTIRVVAGTAQMGDVNPFLQKRQVDENDIFFYENYNDDTFENDICMFKLKEPFIFNEYVNSIRIRDTPIVNATDVYCTFCALEETEGARNWSTMQNIRAKMMDTEVCTTHLANIVHKDESKFKTHMCTNYTGNICEGVWGSPVVCNGLLTGIVSYGYGCGTRQCPQANTDVVQYRQWIEEKKTPLSESLKECVGVAKTDEKDYPRIAGGAEAEMYQFPYQVSIQLNNTHFCGGVLINSATVLTASRCFERIDSVNYENVSFLAGSRKLNPPYDDTFQIRRYGSHTCEIRLPNTAFSDICLIHVTELFTFNEHVHRVFIREEPLSNIADVRCTFSGWGGTEEGGKNLSEALKYIRVPLMDPDECQRQVEFLEKGTNNNSYHFLCTRNPIDNRSPCQGDFGGPLVCDGYLTGVFFFGYGCGRKNCPSVYIDAKGIIPDENEIIHLVTSSSTSSSTFSSTSSSSSSNTPPSISSSSTPSSSTPSSSIPSSSTPSSSIPSSTISNISPSTISSTSSSFLTTAFSTIPPTTLTPSLPDTSTSPVFSTTPITSFITPGTLSTSASTDAPCSTTPSSSSCPPSGNIPPVGQCNTLCSCSCTSSSSARPMPVVLMSLCYP